MPKEILLYSPIYSYTAADFIQQLEENKGRDIVVRMNCPGGEVYSAYGMIAKFAEHAKGKKIKVDGMAKSGGFFMCCYAESVECLDVTDFMVHRAALPPWIENDKQEFTAEMKAMLTRINASLRAGVESKIKADKFKEVMGVSLDELFSMDSRLDVNITAAQAKEMGLVSKIIPLTKEAKAQILSLAATQGVAAFASDPVVQDPSPTETPTPQKTQVMTAAEFKAAHPAAYAQIVQEGIAQERDRVGSFLAFNDIDPEAVVKGIKEGATLSHTQMAEFSRKAFNKQAIGDLEKNSAPDISTNEPAQQPTAEAKAAAEFDAAVNKNLKLKPATA